MPSHKIISRQNVGAEPYTRCFELFARITGVSGPSPPGHGALGGLTGTANLQSVDNTADVLLTCLTVRALTYSSGMAPTLGAWSRLAHPLPVAVEEAHQQANGSDHARRRCSRLQSSPTHREGEGGGDNCGTQGAAETGHSKNRVQRFFLLSHALT